MELISECFGKSILVGEHTVLRGGPAIVLPVKKFSTRFFYTDSDETQLSPLITNYSGDCAKELSVIVPRLILQALEQLRSYTVSQLKEQKILSGRLLIESNLPLGAGLGASAALCVGVTRLLVKKGWLQFNKIYEFATQLEGLFHGESSGIDIAVAIEGRPIKFKRGGERMPLNSSWQPQLFVSYSGEKGLTVDCVNKVKKMIQERPDNALVLDEEMSQAVNLAEDALAVYNEESFLKLTAAITQAKNCFMAWGLCPDFLINHMEELLRAGAKSVKPTGSGGGGNVLSLWLTPPPAHIFKHLTPV